MKLQQVEYENGRLRFTYEDNQGNLKYFSRDIPQDTSSGVVARRLRQLAEQMDLRSD